MISLVSIFDSQSSIAPPYQVELIIKALHAFIIPLTCIYFSLDLPEGNGRVGLGRPHEAWEMVFGIFLPFEFGAGCLKQCSNQIVLCELNFDYLTMGCLSQPIPLARTVMPKESTAEVNTQKPRRRGGGQKPAAVAAAKAKAKAAAKAAAAKAKSKIKPGESHPEDDADAQKPKRRKS